MPLELETIDKPYILFFGRIEEYKGITLLYKVFTESIELSEHYTPCHCRKRNLTLHPHP